MERLPSHFPFWRREWQPCKRGSQLQLKMTEEVAGLGWLDRQWMVWVGLPAWRQSDRARAALLLCLKKKKKVPRQEGWIPFLSCSILKLWQGNNIWWQKLIFPAAPDSAWPQLRPPGSSYLTLPSHHEAFYICSLDTMEEKTRWEITLDAQTTTSHLTYTQSARTETNILGGVISICRPERCRFLFIWLLLFFCCEGATVVLETSILSVRLINKPIFIVSQLWSQES